jgi:hypothetical protein
MITGRAAGFEPHITRRRPSLETYPTLRRNARTGLTRPCQPIFTAVPLTATIIIPFASPSTS